MLSLVDLRNQIDDIDRFIIQELSQGGNNEDCLEEVVELTDEDKEMFRFTGLYFSQRVGVLLRERMQISVGIGRVKYLEGRLAMVDEERKQTMIQSRVEWAPEDLREAVRALYEIVHDISVRIQYEGKNLQK